MEKMRVEDETHDVAVDAVVVNYNGVAKISETIRSLLCQSHPLNRIIVVDDGSIDGSVAMLKNEFPQCHLITFPENRNCVNRARNAGLNACTSPYVLLSDNDIVFDADCVKTMLMYMRRFQNAVLITPRLLYKHEPERVFSDWCHFHYTANVVAPNRNKLVSETIQTASPQTTIGGGIMLVDREKVMLVNGFGEEYLFGWGDDGSLNFALTMRGYGCYCCVDAIGYHPEVTRTVQRAFSLSHNRFVFALEFYQWRTLVLLLPMLILNELVLINLYMYTGGALKYVRAISLFLKEIKVVLARRRFLQSGRVVRDKDIMHAGHIFIPRTLLKNRAAALIYACLNVIFDAYWNCISIFL